MVTSTHPDIATGAHPWSVFEPYIQKERDIKVIRSILHLAEQQDLRAPICNRVIPLPKAVGQGWGGRGRIALIGDAAHAMRPINALGGSMAFEDSVVFCRLINDPNRLLSRATTNEIIAEFENARLPRVKTIWENQWERAERVFAGKKYEQWSKEFKEWIYSGV